MSTSKSRSAAAKKAAQTRKENAEADAKADAQANEQEQPQGEPSSEQEQPQGEPSSETETPTAPNADPPLFKGTENELDDNGETQADRDAAGEARRAKVMANRGSTGDENDGLAAEQPRQALENSGYDHHAAEERRQTELAQARDRHAKLTGDASRGIQGLNAQV